MKALLIASAIALIVMQACGGPQRPQGGDVDRAEILTLWGQIRDYRRQLHMELDPSPMTMNQIRFKNVKDAEKVCVQNPKVPKVCDDVCGLSDAICDNAESICTLADKLGKDDDFAQTKCVDAKASCREGTQKCCKCSADAPS